MDIVKKNIVSVICGVVVLLAVVAYFWPIGSLYSGLQEQVDERQQAHAALNTLLTKPRRQPVVHPDNPQAEQLPRFPSTTVIETGRSAMQQVADESIRLRNAAIELNRRAPLVRGVFPRGSGSLAFAFRDEYRNQMNVGIPRDILQAGMPPDQERITLELNALEQEMEQRAVKDPVTGQILDHERHQQRIQEARAALPRELTARVARQSLIYITPDALAIHPEFAQESAAAAPSPENMWYAQVGLWVQQDIAHALADANRDATNVLDAPVKRLVQVDLGPAPAAARGATRGREWNGGGWGRGGQGNLAGNNLYLFATREIGRADFEDDLRMMQPTTPAAAEPGDADAPLQPNYILSPTGRVSNNMYDVVPFELTMVVEADKIPLVMQRLVSNRLVYVRSVRQIEAVDSALEQSRRFVYGSRPVAQVTFDCEALFLRAWTWELMPQAVRNQLSNQGQAMAAR